MEGGPLRNAYSADVPHELRGDCRHHRPLPARADGPNMHTDTPTEKRPGADLVPAIRLEPILAKDVRGDGVPGAVIEIAQQARRLLASRRPTTSAGQLARRPRGRHRARRDEFLDGCVANGYDSRVRRASCSPSSSRLPTTVQQVTRVGLRLIAYQTAFLKANYPVEYLAALLTSVKANKDKSAVYLNECRQLEHRGARPRRERVRRSRLRRVPRRPSRRSGSGCRRCATSARARGAHRSRRARKADRSPTSTTSASASTRRPSTSARSSR